MNKALLHAALVIAIAALSNTHAWADEISSEVTAAAPDPIAVDSTDSIDTPAIETTSVDEATPVDETAGTGDVAAVVAPAPRLTNTAARMKVGTGDDVGILGFVIAGEGTRNVLIRGVGPALAKMGLSGTLTDPKIDLYSGASLMSSNDDWASNPDVTAATAAAGATPLEADSKDAAMVVTLSPGAYTIVVSGAGNATGMALVEVYDLP